VLTAYQVTAMDLTGTELVNLTACETGVGEIRPDDGVVGLRTAYLMAGARSVTISMWSFPGNETADQISFQLPRLARRGKAGFLQIFRSRVYSGDALIP
jgi:hypothetical protein